MLLGTRILVHLVSEKTGNITLPFSDAVENIEENVICETYTLIHKLFLIEH